MKKTKSWPDSTSVASASYEEETQTLSVVFTKGGVYEYSDVPTFIWKGMLDASSIGRYFKLNVANSFTYKRLN